jgi:tetraacyldisaccharide 4'-kinase
MKSPAFWYEPPGTAANLLAPFGFVWRAGSGVRRLAAKPYRAQKTVICVGNIVAGGAGKTPTAMAIASFLQQTGKSPVFATRGYGGSEHGPTRVDPARHSAHDVGDEALLLARLAPTWIARDRTAAIRMAERTGSHVILDDGLQNPNIEPDISFLVIDGESGFGNERIIPAGPLREPVEDALKRVAAVILVGTDAHNIVARVTCPVIRAALHPALPPDFPVLQKFFAFAGIGRPMKFYATCREAGLNLTGAEDFPDHHQYITADIKRLREQARKSEARLLTTEKDWIRLPKDFRPEVTALPVEMVFSDISVVNRLLGNEKAA